MIEWCFLSIHDFHRYRLLLDSEMSYGNITGYKLAGGKGTVDLLALAHLGNIL